MDIGVAVPAIVRARSVSGNTYPVTPTALTASCTGVGGAVGVATVTARGVGGWCGRRGGAWMGLWGGRLEGVVDEDGDGDDDEDEDDAEEDLEEGGLGGGHCGCVGLEWVEW